MYDWKNYYIAFAIYCCSEIACSVVWGWKLFFFAVLENKTRGKWKSIPSAPQGTVKSAKLLSSNQSQKNTKMHSNAKPAAQSNYKRNVGESARAHWSLLRFDLFQLQRGNLC